MPLVDIHNLAANEETLYAIANKAYRAIIDIPSETRGDMKERTGIWVLIGEPNSKNLVKFPVENPSEASNHFCSEKAVRAHLFEDCSSQNSRDPDLFQFAGCIIVRVLLDQTDGSSIMIQCSVSGLQEPEDVAVAIMILADIFTESRRDICTVVTYFDGELPEEFFQKGNYLNTLLFCS